MKEVRCDAMRCLFLPKGCRHVALAFSADREANFHHGEEDPGRRGAMAIDSSVGSEKEGLRGGRKEENRKMKDRKFKEGAGKNIST